MIHLKTFHPQLQKVKYSLLNLYLNFEYPFESGKVYDFILNNFKFQEKVSRGINIHIQLHKHSHSKNGQNFQKPYCKGDNDFYWINSRCKTFFLLLPESILVENGNIKTETQEGKKSFCYTLNTIKEKFGKYIFYYDNIDKELLFSLIQ